MRVMGHSAGYPPGGLIRAPRRAAVAERATIGNPTVVTQGGSATDQTTAYSTASVTPPANQIVYGAILAAAGVTCPNVTVTSGGMVWTEVATCQFGTSNARRFTVVRGVGAVPSAGVITLTFDGATTITGVTWQFLTATNVASVQQSKTADADTTPGTTGSITFDSAFEHAGNMALVFVGHNGLTSPAVITPDSDFTTIQHSYVGGSPQMGIESERALNQTTCAPSWGSGTWGMIGLELRAA